MDNNLLPTIPGSQELAEHREFVQGMGDIVSSKREITRRDDLIFILELPPHDVLEGIPEARECTFGTIEWDDHCYFVGDENVSEIGDAMEKLRVLSTIRGLVSNQKRKLAIEANKDHDGQYVKPRGKHGHMLHIYEDLLDQIDDIKFRLQRESKRQTEYDAR